MRRKRSRVMSGLGSKPMANPMASAMAGVTLATSGTSARICSNTYSTTSRYVYSSGPAKSYVCPSMNSGSSDNAILWIAAARSPTNRGCTRAAPPPTSVTRGRMLCMFAMRFRKRSSAPYTSAGRTMVAPGASARTASSPRALLRAHADSA
jgi:hypothetical protein